MEIRHPQSINADGSLDSSVLLASSDSSAVCWSAILAGASAATAVSLILLFLGTGLGLTAVSPWAYKGVSGSTFGVSTILWVTFMSLVASGLGGYITGRLRTRWLATHVDEVYFRDTAHGFLAWSIATLVTATLLASVISFIVGGATQAGATIVAGATVAAHDSDKTESETEKLLPYFLDSMFRGNTTITTAGTEFSSVPGSRNDNDASKVELTRIFLNALANKGLPPADLSYASQQLAEHAGINQIEAENRIKETFAKLQTKIEEAKVAADKARKATAYSSLWLFISLLSGAFLASFFAMLGGRQRDM